MESVEIPAGFPTLPTVLGNRWCDFHIPTASSSPDTWNAEKDGRGKKANLRRGGALGIGLSSWARGNGLRRKSPRRARPGGPRADQGDRPTHKTATFISMGGLAGPWKLARKSCRGLFMWSEAADRTSGGSVGRGGGERRARGVEALGRGGPGLAQESGLARRSQLRRSRGIGVCGYGRGVREMGLVCTLLKMSRSG